MDKQWTYFPHLKPNHGLAHRQVLKKTHFYLYCIFFYLTITDDDDTDWLNYTTAEVHNAYLSSAIVCF